MFFLHRWSTILGQGSSRTTAGLSCIIIGEMSSHLWEDFSSPPAMKIQVFAPLFVFRPIGSRVPGPRSEDIFSFFCLIQLFLDFFNCKCDQCSSIREFWYNICEGLIRSRSSNEMSFDFLQRCGSLIRRQERNKAAWWLVIAGTTR